MGGAGCAGVCDGTGAVRPNDFQAVALADTIGAVYRVGGINRMRSSDFVKYLFYNDFLNRNLGERDLLPVS